MLSLHLSKIHIFSYHGIYAEEKVLGNEFEVDVLVKHLPARIPVKHMEDTIDYTSVYELVKKRMEVPTPLLETVVTEIAVQILAQFSLAMHVAVSIKKLHPPIAQFRGSVGVSFELSREVPEK